MTTTNGEPDVTDATADRTGTVPAVLQPDGEYVRRTTTGSYADVLVPGGDGLRFARRRVEVAGRVDL